MPSGMKEFSSFMEQQFSGHFGPFAGKGGSLQIRRQDDDYDMEETQPMESHPDDYDDRRRTSSSKTNYDYHPIIDFFHDKP